MTDYQVWNELKKEALQSFNENKKISNQTAEKVVHLIDKYKSEDVEVILKDNWDVTFLGMICHELDCYPKYQHIIEHARNKLIPSSTWSTPDPF